MLETAKSLLLEEPYPIVVALAGVAVALFTLGIRRRQKQFMNYSGLTILAAAGVVALATWVVTDREQIMTLTQQTVSHTNNHPFNLHALQNTLHPQAVLTGPQGDPWLKGDHLIAQLERLDQKQAILKQQITSITAHLEHHQAGSVALDLKTTLTPNLGQRVVQTRWRVYWQQNQDHVWQIHKVSWLDHPGPLGIKPQAGSWQSRRP